MIDLLKKSAKKFFKNFPEIVFLVGPPRSGTTWLQREITNKSTCPFLPECTLLTQQIELYSRTLHYCEEKRFNAYFANQENLKTYYQDNVRRLIDMTIRLNHAAGSEKFVLKDPQLSLYMEELTELIPQRKLIVIVRDPRDVLASMKNVIAKKQESWNVQEITAQIFSYYYKIGNYTEHAGNDSLFVRYEDLVSEGLDTLQSFLRQEKENLALKENTLLEMEMQLNISDPFLSEYRFKPTTQERIGSYKNILSESELAEVETVFSGVLQRWDY
jgi:hypothetical protein